MGIVYYRVDIKNPTATRLSVGAVYLQFEDDMEISIKKCKLQGADISQYHALAGWADTWGVEKGN